MWRGSIKTMDKLADVRPHEAHRMALAENQDVLEELAPTAAQQRSCRDRINVQAATDPAGPRPRETRAPVCVCG